MWWAHGAAVARRNPPWRAMRHGPGGGGGADKLLRRQVSGLARPRPRRRSSRRFRPAGRSVSSGGGVPLEFGGTESESLPIRRYQRIRLSACHYKNFIDTGVVCYELNFLLYVCHSVQILL